MNVRDCSFDLTSILMSAVANHNTESSQDVQAMSRDWRGQTIINEGAVREERY